MANARKIEVERVIKEPGVALELTEPEAKSLWAILYRVVGDPDPEVSPRGHADSIREAIHEAALGKSPSGWRSEEWAGKYYKSLRHGVGVQARNYDDE